MTQLKEESALVFVYGTLKSNQSNNHLLQYEKNLGVAITDKRYVLYNCGFPLAVPEEVATDSEKAPKASSRNSRSEIHPDLAPILGEVWTASPNTMARLDRLEGEGSFYHRRVIKVIMEETKEEKEVFIYEIHNAYPSSSICEIIDGAYVWSPRTKRLSF